jgi:hypothetical protein
MAAPTQHSRLLQAEILEIRLRPVPAKEDRLRLVKRDIASAQLPAD